MQQTRALLFDSFKSARGSLKPLFSPFHSRAQIGKDIQRFILSRSRHQERLSKSQKRALARANVSLLLQEARRQKNYVVAEAALVVALTESEWVGSVDPAWVKDAAAACVSSQQLGELQELLSASAPVLRGLPVGDATPEGNLLAVLLGGSAGGVVPRAVQLGDEATNANSALSLLDEADGGDETSSPKGDALAVEARLTSEEQAALALARESVHAAGNDGSSLVPRDRAVAAIRRLEEQRDAATVSPNSSFARYMLRQSLVQSETELMELVRAMRARPAQIGFRVHLSHPHGRAARRLLAGREGIARVTWLAPASGAYTLSCADASALQANRTLLRALAKERVISFQSTSSMLPVHFLNPQPGERILDLCAAPGSKSTLILDYMAALRKGAADCRETSVGPSGCVVANEADPGRAAELASRLQNYSTEVLVTRSPGGRFGVAATGPRAVDNAFDKVLVDAPCSGEGRMGRDVMAWRLWHPGQGLRFFPRQVELLQRAVEVCRPGGTIVYATCTLNPIENEAVVAAVLKAFPGVLELVAPPRLTPNTALAGEATGYDIEEGEEEKVLRKAHEVSTDDDKEAQPLVLSAGLRDWAVPSPAGGFYLTAQSAQAQDGVNPTLPRAAFAAMSEEDRVAHQELLNTLRRCCRRVMPHHNGAGAEGFFVAVLRKTAATSATQTHSSLLPPATQSSIGRGVDRQSSSSSSIEPSILQARGLVRLPASSGRVQGLLSPFCEGALPSLDGGAGAPADPIARIMNKSGRSVERLLAQRGWVLLWNDKEGLRITSESAAAVARTLCVSDGGGGRANRSSRAASLSLLETGVLAFDAAGSLTESGAVLLRPVVTSRVVALPPMYIQLLLANRQLDVTAGAQGTSEEDPVRAAHRVTSNNLTGGERRVNDSSVTGTRWQDHLVADLNRQGPGNAIVVVQSGSASSHPSADRAPSAPSEQWASAAKHWCLPVRVERLPASPATLRLHLLLSREARQRHQAMVGRLQGRQRSSASREGVQEYLQGSAELNVSAVMNTKELFGAAPSVRVQQERLFGGAGASSDGHRVRSEEGDDGKGLSVVSDSIFEF